MKDHELITKIQEYYGMRYRPLVAIELAKTLSGETEEYLDIVYHVMTREFSTKWNKLPDAAILNELRGLIIDEYRNTRKPTNALQIEYREELTDDEIKKIEAMTKQFLDMRPGAARMMLAAINYQPEDRS